MQRELFLFNDLLVLGKGQDKPETALSAKLSDKDKQPARLTYKGKATVRVALHCTA